MIWRVTGFNPMSPIGPNQMSQGPVVLTQRGPLIQLTIMPPPAVQARFSAMGKPHQGVPVIALIDSGASCTVTSEKIIRAANLQFTGFEPIHGVHGAVDCPTYFGELHFPWGAVARNPIVQCDLSQQGFDCIIGRNTMAHWLMIYDGLSGLVTICDKTPS